jgi:hypothetical protein
MAANRERGVVSLAIGGASYTLKLTINGMIAAEDESEAIGGVRQTWDDIFARVQQGELRYLVLFLWAMTRKHHAALTRAEVGDLIDEVGGLPGLLTVIQQAVEAAAPDSADVEELGLARPGARPRKARRKAGERSTSTVGAVA